MQFVLHYSLHLIFPLWVAWLFFRKEWKLAYLIFLGTMLVDLDHVLSDPIYQANRCSINFHLLHSYYAIMIYGLALFLPKPFRFIGIGLLLHMVTDLIDCLWMYVKCKSCFSDSPALGLLQFLEKLFGL